MAKTYVLSAAKELNGYRGPCDISKPDPFIKTGFALSNLALIVRTITVKESNQCLLKSCRSFFEFYEADWQLYANNALSTQDEKKEMHLKCFQMKTI